MVMRDCSVFIIEAGSSAIRAMAQEALSDPLRAACTTELAAPCSAWGTVGNRLRHRPVRCQYIIGWG